MRYGIPAIEDGICQEFYRLGYFDRVLLPVCVIKNIRWNRDCRAKLKKLREKKVWVMVLLDGEAVVAVIADG